MSIVAVLYLVPGVVFGLWFYLKGHAVIDASAAGAAWFTRLLLTPAAVLLWPVLVTKAWRLTHE